MNTARVALVTGASQGIGSSIALQLARAGHQVAVHYGRSKDAAKAVVDRIVDEGGVAVAFHADLADFRATEGLVAAVTAGLGAPLIVVNNAGIQHSRALVRQSDEDFMRMLAVNLIAARTVTKHALPAMYDAGWGRVIFVSSVLGATGGPGDTGYAATKGGLLALSKSLAQEVARRGITSNAVLPGTILTDITTHADPDVLAANIAALAIRRGGQAEEVAAAVAFLCTEGASYVNGAELAVHGGGWVALPQTR